MHEPLPNSDPGGSPLVASLMREIAERLEAFASGGDGHAIDLLSLPMSPADRAELEEALGRGEVEATLSVSGTSLVWETGYAGVWWVRHLGEGDRVASERIEIAAIPEILAAQQPDMAMAAERLRAEFENGAAVGRMAGDDKEGLS